MSPSLLYVVLGLAYAYYLFVVMRRIAFGTDEETGGPPRGRVIRLVSRSPERGQAARFAGTQRRVAPSRAVARALDGAPTR